MPKASKFRLTASRRAQLDTMGRLSARAKHLLIASKLLSKPSDFARQYGTAIASVERQELIEATRAYPQVIRWENFPTPDQLGMAVSRGLSESLLVGAVVLTYVACDEAIDQMLTEVSRKCPSGVLALRSGAKIELGQVLAQGGLKKIKKEQIGAWLRTTLEGSIRKKAELLYGLVPMPRNGMVPTIADLSRLQEMRHALAHKSGHGLTLQQVGAVLSSSIRHMNLLQFWVWDSVDGDYRHFNLDTMRKLGSAPVELS